MFKPILISFFFILLFPSWANAGNQLDGHDSPYLAMHGEDPVAWQGWSAGVLEKAKAANRLIFVSIGYFSCHWCHVMQRESFQNKDVAKQLNEHFISVKVDRELNPDLDAYLIDFVTRTRGSAGWPLNVFLTPDGYPLVGFTYLPADRFLALLQELQQQWQQAPDYFKQVASRAADAMAGEPPKPEPELKPASASQYERVYVVQALELADDMSGGFGEQTKFPMVPHMDSLLSAYQRNPDPAVKKLLITTLDNMATQGMRDHLGGGFYRYTVDPNWQIPHFEKMLYDNALLVPLYLRAANILARADYELVARDTLDFMVSEMTGSTGAMVASFSAIDDNNIEGGYYLWHKEELAILLNENELKLVNHLWGMQGNPELEAGKLPRIQVLPEQAAQALNLKPQEAENLLLSARKKMLRARSQRVLPVDDKYLAAWNGLALTALVEGAKLEGGEKYRDAARKIRDYLVNVLWDGNRLWRARGSSGELGQAGLEDYAFVAEGLLSWVDLNNKKTSVQDKDFKLVMRLVNDAWKRFHDKTGWRLSDQTLLPSGYGVPMMAESPLPSPSAVLLRISMETAHRLDDKALIEKTRKSMNAGHSQLSQVAFDYPSQVSLLAKLFETN
ncbi:thioredoxin domain-containing protein [Kaarinaea lacus]